MSFDYLTYHCTFFVASQCILLMLVPVFSTLTLPDDPKTISLSCLLPSDLCQLTGYDTFLVSVALWATLQLSWTIVLLASQLWQVARQMTTLEVSNLGRYGFMGGRGGAVPEQAAGSDEHKHNHKHRHGGFIMHLLGFDRFTKGRAVDGLAKSGKALNPFDLGLVGNCKDFWTAGRELGVEYDKLYDVPMEGFKEAKRRRDREEEDDGKRGARRGLLGLVMGSRRTEYEPVNQV